MQTQMTRRQATPARWQAALARAIAEGVQARQLAGSGAWVATSGTDAGTTYGLAVTADVAHGCECPAAVHGDPVCKHRAAFYAAVGVLELAGDGSAPAPATMPPGRVVCPGCGRGGIVLQDKPLPADWMCGWCRPPAPRPAPAWPVPVDVAALAA